MNDSEEFSKNKELYEFQSKELENIDIHLGEDFELQDTIDTLKKNKSTYEDVPERMC